MTGRVMSAFCDVSALLVDSWVRFLTGMLCSALIQT